MKTKIAAVCIVVLVAFLLALSATAKAASPYPEYKDGFLTYDKGRAPIQIFAPKPTLSSNTSIANGATYTVECVGWIAIRWYASGLLKRSLNDNTAYFSGREEILGVDPDVEEVVFTNNSGAAVYLDVEGM